MSDRPLVLFHGSCADGFCSAWAAHRKFGDGADYLAVNYGEEPPDVTGREVYVLDFSYKRDVTLAMLAKCKGMVVLDHHRTAQQELEGLTHEKLHLVFDMDKSGAMLSWEFFHPAKPVPWLVEYVQDRDLWRWRLPRSRAVSAGIASHPFDFALWDGWFGTADGTIKDTPEGYTELSWLDLLASDGEAILRYQNQQVESQCKYACEVDIAGHKVLVVNATLLTSEIAGKLAESRPFGCTFFLNAKGQRVWSLRSREGGVDVSEIARQFGGGGHREAAGYTEAS